jgi:hypothetical protein
LLYLDAAVLEKDEPGRRETAQGAETKRQGDALRR